MVQDEGADAGFGFHHETFGEGDADVGGAEEFEDAGLVFERGAGGVTGAVAFAAVPGLETVELRGQRFTIHRTLSRVIINPNESPPNRRDQQTRQRRHQHCPQRQCHDQRLRCP